MAQIIPNEYGNVSGRIGKGFGKALSEGLAEQIPKEAAQYRLSSGLKQFEQDSANLTPMQALTRLSSIPGAVDRPQLIQSFGELAKQQQKGNALKAGLDKKDVVNPFKNREGTVDESAGIDKKPSITTSKGVEETRKPYIPPTLKQIQNRAGQLLDENPALYNNDPQLALQAAKDEANQEQAINQAYQTQRTNEQDVQNTITNGLREQQKDLGAVVPGNVYSKIEDKAINAVKSKAEGGEGLTEQQAKKKYGDELDKVSRQYQALKSIGDWSILTRTPSGNKDAINSIKEDFKKRNDLENFADTLIAENGLSPSKAYYMAYPVSENKELNNAIQKLPDISKGTSFRTLKELVSPDVERKTMEISKKLAPLIKGGQGSPLAIAEELKAKGLDPQVWMKYLDKNRKELNLSEQQGRELNQPRDFIPSINDWWMFTFSGLEKLLEQE